MRQPGTSSWPCGGAHGARVSGVACDSNAMPMNSSVSHNSAVVPILLAIILGGLSGWAIGPDTRFGGFEPLRLFELLGTVFLNLLKMLIVPLIAASIITSVASFGSGDKLGRLSRRTLFYFLLTTLIAVLIALPIVNLVQPGIVNGVPAGQQLVLEAESATAAASVAERASGGVFGVLLGIVPGNIVEAAANNNILALVLFSILFGLFVDRVEEPYRAAVLGFWQGTLRAMMRMTDWVMLLAPVGVFALTVQAVAQSGIAAAGPLLTFSACVIGGLAVYTLLVIPLLVRMAARVSPWALLSAMSPALLTAFSTASSRHLCRSLLTAFKDELACPRESRIS